MKRYSTPTGEQEAVKGNRQNRKMFFLRYRIADKRKFIYCAHFLVKKYRLSGEITLYTCNFLFKRNRAKKGLSVNIG